MSISLVKKSLQLLESTEIRGNRNKRSYKDSSKSEKLSVKKSNSDSKVCKRNTQESNFVKTLKKIQKEYKREKDKDKTELNLQKLKTLNENLIENKKVTEFFKRASKNREVKIVEKEEEQSTVFTEEDFAKFEREYVFE
ncbi:uncharacterized protein LOC142326823 [Lycorma delicatula]|uniref:uncharacterized protein LOC142326823 n=1 Tax=Lycorma delicatula TaxID=130591 RepID=UPI003F51442E